MGVRTTTIEEAQTRMAPPGTTTNRRTITTATPGGTEATQMIQGRRSARPRTVARQGASKSAGNEAGKRSTKPTKPDNASETTNTEAGRHELPGDW